MIDDATTPARVAGPISGTIEPQAIERLSREELRAYQLERLNSLFAEVLPTNAFYRRRLGTSLRLGRLEELAELPLTTKTDLGRSR